MIDSRSALAAQEKDVENFLDGLKDQYTRGMHRAAKINAMVFGAIVAPAVLRKIGGP